jgi:hypothetical protein
MPVHGKGLLTVQALIIKKGAQRETTTTDHRGTSGSD